MGLKNSKAIKFETQDSKYKFKKIIVVKDFEAKNGVLGLDRDIYLSIVKFLDSSTVRKVNKYFIFLFILLILFLSTLELVKNHLNE
jgi:hypothetical protein